MSKKNSLTRLEELQAKEYNCLLNVAVGEGSVQRRCGQNRKKGVAEMGMDPEREDSVHYMFAYEFSSEGD